jgi:DMSO/TMAO reductase YedYZ molybdopterin-dependent catalytic subunit
VLGAGLGELTAAFIAPGASPFAAIGSALIDLAPPWAKDAAISLFGTNDKLALLVGIAIVMIVVAAAAGLVELWRPPWGRVIMLAFGAAGILAAMTRADAGPLDWIPSTVAGLAAAGSLWLLMQRIPAARPVPRDPTARAEAASRARVERRTFIGWTVAAAAVGILAAVGGTLVRAGSNAVASVRQAIKLPAPAVTAPPVPPGAELNIPGVAKIVTPNESFYRIDTALIVPQIDPADWTLKIHGMVDHEITLTWDELLALPLEESITTLACVSNPVGGDLISNAVWLGYPIRELLARAKPASNADMVLSHSIDGFTASTPLEVLQEKGRNAILAVGMNGTTLPPEHGFPVRMVVPGLYGYVSATKWVTELEVTRFDRATAYWTDRGWSDHGPVKLESRVDVPRRGQGLKAGATVIAGVAWHQHVGIDKVEVQIDDGPWHEATLATEISDDTWVQWSTPWTATKGDHLIRCRATNKNGELQTETDADPAPDGATGWHEREVNVFA